MPHKLLIADDSVTIQRVIELTFADEDITVIAVGDGRQAIERVQSDRPDIVLADVGMPERDGYEVAAFVKGSPDLAHIPVLLLTGAFEPIDEGRAQAAGCDGVLVKPFEPQMVISRVKDLIAGRHPVRKMPAPPTAAPHTPETMRAAAAAPAPPAVHADDRGTQPAAGAIEEYFDRLDAAFASFDAPPAAPPHGESLNRSRQSQAPPPDQSGLADELANWDPDLVSARRSRPDTATPEQSAPRPAADAPVPTLAEAFAALLAAEQGQAVAPAAVPREAVAADVIEQVTRRVIERMSDAAVREIVLDVAERLVREEIDRIKSSSRDRDSR